MAASLCLHPSICFDSPLSPDYQSPSVISSRVFVGDSESERIRANPSEPNRRELNRRVRDWRRGIAENGSRSVAACENNENSENRKPREPRTIRQINRSNVRTESERCFKTRSFLIAQFRVHSPVAAPVRFSLRLARTRSSALPLISNRLVE